MRDLGRVESDGTPRGLTLAAVQCAVRPLGLHTFQRRTNALRLRPTTPLVASHTKDRRAVDHPRPGVPPMDSPGNSPPSRPSPSGAPRRPCRPRSRTCIVTLHSELRDARPARWYSGGPPGRSADLRNTDRANARHAEGDAPVTGPASPPAPVEECRIGARRDLGHPLGPSPPW